MVGGRNRGKAAPHCSAPHRWACVGQRPGSTAWSLGLGRWFEGGAWPVGRLVRGLCRHGASPLQHAAEALLGPCCSLTSCRKISKKSGSSAYCVSATSYIFDSDDHAGVKCSPTPQLVVGMGWSGSASGGREVPQGPAKLQPNRWWERYRAAAGAVTMRST